MKLIQSYQSPKLRQDEIVIGSPKQKIYSEYLQSYKNMIGQGTSNENLQAILFKHKIIYTPSSSFQEFSFQVQSIVPVPDFYKINVKIAHFALSLTALRHYSLNTLKQPYKSRGIFGKIFFAEFNNKNICFKGFSFSNEEQFQPLFRRMVKELSILRICSALECGPYFENYFGFDLIIYDNCIQYATQKGQIITQFTKQYQQHLQYQLSLLHRLKIIHYDIKPENIIFSKTFQKPVFIDFGLSQIIEEQLGFKTLGFFRGTPRYCTQQMLSLMMVQQNYVDLYYNDAFCLYVSSQQMQNQNYDESINEEDQPMQKVINIQQPLYMFSFKYHYLHGNEFECKDSLQKYLYFEGNVKIVLEFIKYVFRYTFIDPIFDQYLKKYKDHSLYQKIDEERKRYLEKIFIQRRQEGEELLYSEILLAPMSYLPNDHDQDDLERGKIRKDCINCFQVIMKIKILEEKTVWDYLSLVFTCVRFDIRNLSVQQKDSIAKKINPLLATFCGKQSPKIKQITELEQIKLLLTSILEFCLEGRPNIWSKDKLIDIFEQLAILDVDLSPYVDPFLRYFEFDISIPLQSILSVLQCNRLKNTMLLINSDHMEKVEIVQNKICLFIHRNLRKFKEQTFSNSDMEIQSIHRILSIILIKDDNICSKLIAKQDDLLSSINHPKVRKSLLYLLIQKNISFQHFITQGKYVLEKAQYIKRCWHNHKLDFFCWLEATIKIMKITSSNSQLQYFFKEIGRIINCEEIMKNIMQNSWLLLKYNQTIFKEKINKLLVSYPKLGSQSKQVDMILHQIIQEVSTGSFIIDQKLCQQLKQLYISYQNSYVKFNSQKKAENFELLHNFCQAYWSAEVEAFFYSFSQQTQGMLKLKLSQAENEIRIITNNGHIDEYQNYYKFFKLYLYRFTFYKLENKTQQCIDNLVLFISHCEKLNLQMLTLEGLKKINQLACEIKIIPLIIASINELYSYCIKIKYLTFYLLPHHSFFTFSTITVFAQNNQDKFYEFIEILIKFLHDHPIDSYFATLSTAFDNFLQKDPKHGYLIHYSRLEERFQCLLNNPFFLIFYMYSLGNENDITNKFKILKTIAAHVDQLSRFAKKKILEKYFTVYLRFFRDKKIQQRMFNFRQAKIYLKQDKIIFETKRLFLKLSRSIIIQNISQMMKKKILKIIKNANVNDNILLYSCLYIFK